MNIIWLNKTPFTIGPPKTGLHRDERATWTRRQHHSCHSY